MEQLPPLVGAKVFDLGVNMGPRVAIRLLQRALNKLSPFDDIAEDGAIGPQTLTALFGQPEAAIVAQLRLLASQRYHDIANAHPNMAKYLAGWLRRATS